MTTVPLRVPLNKRAIRLHRQKIDEIKYFETQSEESYRESMRVLREAREEYDIAFAVRHSLDPTKPIEEQITTWENQQIKIVEA